MAAALAAAAAAATSLRVRGLARCRIETRPTSIACSPVQPLPPPSPHEQEPKAQQDGGSRDSDDDKDADDGSSIVEERARASSRVATAIVQAPARVPDDLGDGVEHSVGIRLNDGRGDGGRCGGDQLATVVGGRDEDGVGDLGRHDSRCHAGRQSEGATRGVGKSARRHTMRAASDAHLVLLVGALVTPWLAGTVTT